LAAFSSKQDHPTEQMKISSCVAFLKTLQKKNLSRKKNSQKVFQQSAQVIPILPRIFVLLTAAFCPLLPVHQSSDFKRILFFY
jgi:hypothetical protein